MQSSDCRRGAKLPRSLRSVADARAARTDDKIGHSGRDDRRVKGQRECRTARRVDQPRLRSPTDGGPACLRRPCGLKTEESEAEWAADYGS